MLSSYPITTLLLVLSSSSISAATAKKDGAIPRRNHEQPPHHHNRKLPNRKEFQEDLYGNSKRSAVLRKKFIAKSTFVGGRKLDGEEEAEDYYYDDVQIDNEYGFEPSKYALSYHRCAAVRQFDGTVAAEEDSVGVFAINNFAIFRFCPVDTCDADAAAYDDQYQDGDEDDGQGDGRRLEDADEDGEDEDEDGNEEEEEVLYGARGQGCNSDYGEYMIELQDYLQIMAEHQQERGEQYCTFCEDYMYEVYQEYVSNCSQNYDCRLRRTLKYEDFKKQDPSSSAVHQHNRDLGNFDYGVCTNFPYFCDEDGDDNDITEYFECQEANGAYVGPHCAEDGFTVTLGVYADEDCNDFTGEDVSSYIGEDLDEDALKNWYNSRHGTLDMVYEGQEASVCIPCQDQGVDFENLNQDDDDAVDDDSMSELCQQVFDTSAHCNQHYRSFKKGNLSKVEWQEMQLSCTFIDSIVMGNYDEMGYVNLKNDWNYRDQQDNSNPQWMRDNMYASQVGRVVSDVSPLQVCFLIFSILACGILAAWSKTLHTSLTKKEPWAPRRAWYAKHVFRRQDSGISPSDSGIGASRVRSDATSYYVS